jgi:hypothetical protein
MPLFFFSQGRVRAVRSVSSDGIVKLRRIVAQVLP